MDKPTHDDDDLFSPIGASNTSHEIMLQQAARIARLGYFVFDIRDQIVVTCSRRHAAIFGVTPEAFVKAATGVRGAMTMVVPEDVAIIRDAYARLTSGEQIELEYRFRHADGWIGHIREFVAPEFDGDGIVRRGLGSSLDITEARAAEERAWQSRRLEMLGALTAGVAHDFNNILAVAMGNAELGLELTRDPEVHDLFISIVDAARRGGTLTASLLTFAQQARTEPASLDLNAEAGAALDAFGRTDMDGPAVTRALGDAALPVRLDRKQLRTVLTHLLQNAAEATRGEDAEISLATSLLETGRRPAAGAGPDLAPGSYGVITVSDTGPGIAVNDLPRVTDPFFTTKNRARGSGLGLSIAQGFARQAGGGIEVVSEKGRGTVVRLFLPISAAPPDAPAADPGPDNATPERRLLYLEDEPSVADALSRQLANAGFRVTLVEDAAAARAALANASFDIAIFDNLLGEGESGLELATDLRDMGHRMPIILLTGLPEDLPWRDRAAVDSVLHKPAAFSRLLTEIKGLLDRAR